MYINEESFTNNVEKVKDIECEEESHSGSGQIMKYIINESNEYFLVCSTSIR